MARRFHKTSSGARRVTSIFSRVRLHQSQLRTVADRRLEDALCLQRTGVNARANGAMYLGGFVIECLLKAKLLAKFPWLRSAAYPDNRSRQDRRLWYLCYQSHQLDEILSHLPEVGLRLAAAGQRGDNRLHDNLRQICASWTVFARYSPRSATSSEAGDFLNRIRELKRWLE